METKQKILHVDGDAFFASVERTRFPYLYHSPVVVGEERGIATAVTYEAKKLGVKRGMPIFQIRRDFPSVTVLPTHFELYEMYRQKLVAMLQRFSGNVEAYSIDECFALLDYKDAERHGGWQSFLTYIKSEIQKTLGITYSFGLADTKVLAKVASKAEKPNGKTFITKENIEVYLKNTKVENIWGIGVETSIKLNNAGIKTALDFANLDMRELQKYAAPFKEIWSELNGISVLCVHKGGKHYSKSLQATRTFQNSKDKNFVFSELSKNIENAFSRLRSEGQLAKKARIFLKQSNFIIIRKEIELSYATNNPREVVSKARAMLPYIFEAHTTYRASGVTLYDLLPEEFFQPDLFCEHNEKRDTEKYLRSVDKLRERYGSSIICLASSLSSLKKREDSHALRHLNDTYIYGLPFPYLGEVF